MIIKLALRNIIRLPWRTIIYFSIVFFIVLAVSASAFVYKACTGTEDALENSYIFVASLVPRSKSVKISLGDMKYCVKNADIVSFNVSMSENNGKVAGGENMFRLPEKVAPENAATLWKDEAKCGITAVENLYLVHSFFSGECEIISGTGLTESGYLGDKTELVIPWWLAEENNISVGDTVVRRYSRTDVNAGNFLFMEGEVVGIYKSKLSSPDYENYPAYIPLAASELDYGCIGGSVFSTSDFYIERADFVLRGRESFEGFVRNAEASGLDFKRADMLFNNSSYDVLSEELGSVSTIALIVFITVLSVGICVLVFFTVYFGNSRKKETEILRALGMKRGSIAMMMVAELVIISVFAVAGGFAVGKLSAEGVCGYVNSTVLAQASESAVLRNSGESTKNYSYAPMERETKIEISISGGTADISPLPVNYVNYIGEGEFGISRHTFYEVGKLETITENDWTPVRVVGISDISRVKTSVTPDEIKSRENYSDDNIYVFVSENADYSERRFLTLGAFEKRSYVILSPGGADAALLPGKRTNIIVAGTYAPNEYCSEDDILVLMDDYHRIYSRLSITDDNFRFERTGEIYEIGGNKNGDS